MSLALLLWKWVSQKSPRTLHNRSSAFVCKLPVADQYWTGFVLWREWHWLLHCQRVTRSPLGVSSHNGNAVLFHKTYSALPYIIRLQCAVLLKNAVVWCVWNRNMWTEHARYNHCLRLLFPSRLRGAVSSSPSRIYLRDKAVIISQLRSERNVFPCWPSLLWRHIWTCKWV